MRRRVHLRRQCAARSQLPLRAQVFATVSRALGPHLRRIPDGETGERGDWITWLEPIFANDPALEKSDEVFRVHAGAGAHTRYRLKPGKTVADVRFDNLFYADIAKQSYAEFAALKEQGVVPAHVQVPDRPGAGAFGDLAVPAGRPASAARSGLQRRAQARDRQDRARPAARSDRHPVRRRLRGVRAPAAQRAERLRQGPRGDAGALCRHPRAISPRTCRPTSS